MKKQSGSHIRLQSRARKLVANDAKLMSELLSMRRAKDIADDTVARRMGVTVEQLIAIDSGTIDPTLGQVRRYAHAIGALVEHSVMDEAYAERKDTVALTHESGTVELSVVKSSSDDGGLVKVELIDGGPVVSQTTIHSSEVVS